MNPVSALPVDRRPERTHLFMMATLAWGCSSSAVRVRNLSATGALVEGASLPPVGSTILLSRGALQAIGTIVWSGAGKAGLSFSGSVDVAGWLPTKDAKRSVMIDPIAGVPQVRAGDWVSPLIIRGAVSRESVLAVLATVEALIDQLGSDLELDMALLTKHPELQLLAETGERIGRIMRVLRAAKD